MNPSEQMVRNPTVCGGQPTFRGTRVTLRTVLASLAEGESSSAISASFTSLSGAHLDAAIAFAAASALEDEPLPALPRVS